MSALLHYNDDDIERALSALDYLTPPLEREAWVKLLMAAHDAGVSEDEAQAWSERGENFDAADFRSTWRSIKPGAVTRRTLFKHAIEAGWNAQADNKRLCQAEIAARDAERARRWEQAAKQKAKRHAKAADRANRIWNEAKPANEHPYLSHKGVNAHGLRIGRWVKVDHETGAMCVVSEQALLIPLRDASKRIHSLQAIFPSRDNMLDRDRDYLAFGAKEGHFFTIGKPQTVAGRKVIAICEGYSTGASIFECTGHAVVVAFDKGNLSAVAKTIRGRFPAADIVIFSDRDAEALNESGGTKEALKAALATGARIVVPEWTGQKGRDANDIHRHGFTWAGETFLGADILHSCLTFATPCRSPAFMEMLEECGIEAENFAPTPAPAACAASEQPTRAESGTAVSEILLEPGELSRTVDLAEQALLARAPTIYTRGGRIVRAIRVPTTIVDGKTAEITQIKPITKHALAEELTKVATWIKSDGRRSEGDNRVRVNCPLNVADTLMAREQWRLRPLTAIIHGPTLRSDGTVLEGAGYDQATGLLLEPHAAFASVPQNPSREVALAALARLGELVREFPFVDAADKSVWFAGLLTAAIRRSLATAPMFAFSAPSAGTGKSFMADLIALITTGERSPVLAQGSGEEETEKRLAGVLLAGHTIVNIDNCTDPIDGDFLCQLLTQPIVQVRKLGGSDVSSVPGSSTMMATGNNLVIAGDMTRRTLLCRLDSGLERPELRTFDFDPLEKAQRGRSGYLVDALTILRAFHVAGRPNQPKPLGSFEFWSGWVRGALLWLDMADPCAVMERSRTADPALSNLRQVLHGLHKAFGSRKVRVREIIAKAATPVSSAPDSCAGEEYENPDLREALLGAAGADGAINNKMLGRWLAAHLGRPVDGLRLMEDGTDRDGVKLWMVVSDAAL